MARNTIMDLMRGKSTPVGRAFAESLKKQGKTLDELIVQKTRKMYGNHAHFDRLSIEQQKRVYAEIVKSAGKPRPGISATMAKLSRAGRGLIVFSLACSAYHIYAAEDKKRAVAKEATITGAGVLGGIGGGTAAGLVCGPAAPVCSTVGAVAGGFLTAFGVSMLW